MNIKNWPDIYHHWLSFNVSAIEFIKYDHNIHSEHYSWFDKKKNAQIDSRGNSNETIGSHLTRYLRDKPQELIDAYKIFAFLKFAKLDRFYDIVKEPFEKYGENIDGWWDSRSKYILPHYSGVSYDQFKPKGNLLIPEVISLAAQTWIKIAEEFALIITPNHMTTEEYEKYCIKDNDATIEKKKQLSVIAEAFLKAKNKLKPD